MSSDSDEIADNVMSLNTTKPLPPFLANMVIGTTPQATFEKADHFNVEAGAIEDKANNTFAKYSHLKTKAEMLRSSACDLQRLAAQDRDQIASVLEQVLQDHTKVLPRYKNNAKRAQLLDDLLLRSEEGLVNSEEIFELYQKLQAFSQWKMSANDEFEGASAGERPTARGLKRRRPSISSSELGMNTVTTSRKGTASTQTRETEVQFDGDLSDTDDKVGRVFNPGNNDGSPAKSTGMPEIEESLSEGQGDDNDNNNQGHHSDSDALSIELGTPCQVNKQKKVTSGLPVRFPTFNLDDGQKQEVTTRDAIVRKGGTVEKMRDTKNEYVNHESKQDSLSRQSRDEDHEQKQKRDKPKKKKTKKAKRNKQVDETTYETDHNLNGKLKSSLKNMKKIAYEF